MTLSPQATLPAHQAPVCIIGGGPAGLFAAEIISQQGWAVDLYDRMPSVGRKFLQAGRGGLNLTHGEPLADFCRRYYEASDWMTPQLMAFGADALRQWAQGLGVETFVGSSGRVFPSDMKAAPLLRAWLQRLKQAGVRFYPRHRWQGWNEGGALRFDTPEGPVVRTAQATLLALGGGSWSRLGSDGSWLPTLAAAGVEVAPLQPANCGFDCDWSDHFAQRFAGEPLKTVVLSCDTPAGMQNKRGEAMITASGIEGSLIYPFVPLLRRQLAEQGQARVWLDLLPDRSEDQVLSALSQSRGSKSLANHLRSRLKLDGVKAGLLRECLPADTLQQMPLLAQAIKALPLTLTRTRPLDEAISTAGGICLSALDEGLMLRHQPGLFAAGEMLDWEAPTGGYLLTGCYATAHTAALGLLHYLNR
ncbi:MAG: TIGR03862 family flavoprotein [Aeromonadaceae bacterium]|nr:TIGR03862 family flavoprotein [Aeromonadaceae bacterium]